MKDKDIIFPKGFFWGAATAAHQVEGGLKNDWTEWEASPKRLAELERSGLIKKYGKDNFMSGRAADQYRLFADDFKLARELGHNATRFSLEWSRLEPEEGRFNEKEFAHYREVIRAARANGLEPFVTLWHWTLPLWVRDQGGWQNGKTIGDFARFTEKVALEFGADVQFWLTLNEPEVYAIESYLQGIRPPQKRSPLAYLRVLRHLVLAHHAAYAVMRQMLPGAQVGLASHQIHFVSAPHDPIGWLIKKLADWWWNGRFIAKSADCLDFIGVNNYFRMPVGIGRGNAPSVPKSDLGWELHPDSLKSVLLGLKHFKKPLYVTESGLADAEDKLRPWFIRETLKGVHQAIASGAEVRGYLHWSLLDNFEWESGFWPRFGLIAIDHKTLKRTPRPSAFLYRDICRANELKNAFGEDGDRDGNASAGGN